MVYHMHGCSFEKGEMNTKILFLVFAITDFIFFDDHAFFCPLFCLSAVGGRHGMDIAKFETT